MGGAREENEGKVKLIAGAFAMTTDWVYCVPTKKYCWSWSKPTLAWTRWQEIQSKSTWDDLRSWSCRGLPNKTMTLKQINNTIAADLDLVKFNLDELKKSIQLISLILLLISDAFFKIRIYLKFMLSLPFIYLTEEHRSDLLKHSTRFTMLWHKRKLKVTIVFISGVKKWAGNFW
jgi:hypothetical protein